VSLVSLEDFYDKNLDNKRLRFYIALVLKGWGQMKESGKDKKREKLNQKRM
jgi:hypothetical protein